MEPDEIKTPELKDQTPAPEAGAQSNPPEPEKTGEAPVADTPTPAKLSPVAVRQATRDTLRNQPQVKIMIPSTEQDKDPVPVGVNGYTYLIKRDEIVPVPESVVGVLLDAKYELYSQRPRKDGEEGNELIKTVAQAIPFQRF